MREAFYSQLWDGVDCLTTKGSGVVFQVRKADRRMRKAFYSHMKGPNMARGG